MAQSARTASLLEQRRIDTALRRFSASGKRSLPPNSLAASVQTIGRKNLEAEIQEIRRKYDDGLISNEEMRSFLKSHQDSSLLTPNEKVDMEDTLRNLDIKIRTSKLESAYKIAQPNSMQKIQAATALANYYSSYAATLTPDTPAHSDAIQKAGEWANMATSDQDKMEKSQRQLMRAQKMYEASRLDTSTVKGLQDKAQLYQDLANQARLDGEETEAINYETQTQNILNQVPSLSTKISKKTITDSLNTLANDYHDGRINTSQYLEKLGTLATQVDDTGDTALALNYNRAVDTAQKLANREKETSATSGWDKEDFDYSDELQKATTALTSGQVDGNGYISLISGTISRREQQLQNRYAQLYEIASGNSNARVMYNGRATKVSDALDDIVKENDDLAGQIDAVNNKQFGLVEVPPDQFNASGDLKKSGKSEVTYRFVDLRNVPEGQYAPDSSGVLHQVVRKPVEISLDEYQTGSLENPAAYSYDKGTGKYFKLGPATVDFYQPGTPNKQSLSYESGKVITPPVFQPSVPQNQPKVETSITQPTVAPYQEKPTVSTPQKPAPVQLPKVDNTVLKSTVTQTPPSTPLATKINLNPVTPAPSAQIKLVVPAAPQNQSQPNILQQGWDWLKGGVKNLATKIFGG